MIRFIKRFLRFRTLLSFLTIVGLVSLCLSYISPFFHPKTFGFLPFFGLAYWPILIGIFTLLILWSFMKSKWALVVLVFILIGGNLHFRTIAIGSDDEKSNGTEFHIMSYNVRLFDLYNTIESKSYKTKDLIFDYLSEKEPDIVCFQEFYQQDSPTKFTTKDSIRIILNSVGVHERYAHKLKGRQNFGIALFSKYPIIEKGNVSFPTAHSTFNYCIYADIVKNKDTIRVYNVHLQSIKLQKDDYALFAEDNTSSANQSSNLVNLLLKIKRAYPYRAEQADIITDHIKTSPFPVVVCGDFNDTPLSYCYNQFNEILIDSYRNTSKGLGTTYAGRIPAGRIDYIFHSPLMGSKNFSIQKETLSDHYAIDCTVFMKKDE